LTLKLATLKLMRVKYLLAIDSKLVTQMLKSGLFESVLAMFADLVDGQRD
jgi:hypothetical protein